MKRMKPLLFATVLFVLLGASSSGAPNVLDDAATGTLAGLSTRKAPIVTVTDVDREIILATVRRYRPTTDESWVGVLAESVHSEARAAGVDP
ncbi:MAG: hypothetical protein R3344_11735, partial [Acidobacteriota bacterium]|nr:hypothetical protein [Acidobacteriota bacterium]